MKSITAWMFLSLTFVVMSLSTTAFAADEAAAPTHLYGNHVCPITDEPVKPESFVLYEDAENKVYGRIYTCCDGCKKKAEADAKAIYMKLYRTDPKTGESVEPKDLKNAKCPVSGADVAEGAHLEYNGMIVHFCCDNCPKAFLKDPEKSMAILLPDAKEFELPKEEKK